MKGHLSGSAEPIKSGTTVRALCGAEVHNVAFALEQDVWKSPYRYTSLVVSGEEAMHATSARVCQKCLAESLSASEPRKEAAEKLTERIF